MPGTVTVKKQMKTFPEHSNQTVVFDTKIYTVVSEVSIRFEENYQQIFRKQSCRGFLKSICFKKFLKIADRRPVTF